MEELTPEELQRQLALIQQTKEDRATINNVVGTAGKSLAVLGAPFADAVSIPGRVVQTGVNGLVRGSNALLGTTVSPMPDTPWETPWAIKNFMGDDASPAMTMAPDAVNAGPPRSAMGAAVDPMAKWNAILRDGAKIPAVVAGGGVAAPIVIDKSAATETASELKKAYEQWATDRKTDQALARETILKQLPPQAFNSLKEYQKLDAETPKIDESQGQTARILAHLPFMVNGRMDWTGAAERSARKNEADRIDFRDQKRERTDAIYKNLGFAQHDVDQINKVQEFMNERDAKLAATKSVFDPALAAHQLTGINEVGRMKQSDSHLRQEEQFQAREHAANRANASANAAMHLPGAQADAFQQLLAREVAAGRLSPQKADAAWEQFGLHVPQPKEVAPPSAGLISAADAKLDAIPGMAKIRQSKDPRAGAIIQAYNQNSLSDPARAYTIAVKNIQDFDEALKAGR